MRKIRNVVSMIFIGTGLMLGWIGYKIGGGD